MTGSLLERILRRAARAWRCTFGSVAHTGPDEHPVGSVPTCPGCRTWLDDCGC